MGDPRSCHLVGAKYKYVMSSTVENESSVQALTKTLRELNEVATAREREIAQTAEGMMKESVKLAELMLSVSQVDGGASNIDTDKITAALKEKIGKLTEAISSSVPCPSAATGDDGNKGDLAPVIERALNNAVQHSNNLNALASSALTQGILTMYSFVGEAFKEVSPNQGADLS